MYGYELNFLLACYDLNYFVKDDWIKERDSSCVNNYIEMGLVFWIVFTLIRRDYNYN